jgi:outer membrane receptor protein involved in Fe transport
VTYTTANERISASFFVNNLLDTTYRNHALPAAAPGITGDIVQYGDPRTIGGSLIYRF